ncbi:hypothetical protein [Methylobacterium sp. 37f]|uniref:Rz1-like lysis system protein LysC n=1 Tax=Methylobacterium sp. 37f TaxID=2817058 RepID=UPI001FFC3536|nr:hypothetical protein [Methylobacterium sp. 37f]MCK2057171.1 hypothetical protein [Methylobacterium sp. 37f]
MTRIAILAAVALGLAGCQTVTSPTVPASLLTCAGEPAWRRGGTQRDVAGYVSDLRDARADCADRLGAVGRIVAPAP